MTSARALALAILVAANGCGRSGFDRGGAPGPVLAIATGAAHSCALLTGGRVRCWGFNANGELGRGDSDPGTEADAPTGSDLDLGGPVRQLAAGAHHTCALLDGGRVRCWGANGNGQLGYGHRNSVGNDEPPSAAGDVEVGGAVVQLAAGLAFTCALLDTGRVRCWGDAGSGQLGHANTIDLGDDELPAVAGDLELGELATQIVAGNSHACAVLSDGRVRCWGDGASGKLGYGATADVGDNELPSSAGDVMIGGPVAALAAGADHTCALLTTGRVKCWGAASDGRLGYANTISGLRPVEVGELDLGGAAIALAAGGRHTCAVLDGGAVRCWGSGQVGQLGYGNRADLGDNEPPSAAGDVDVGGPATRIAAGAAHTCAVVHGNARCWGAAAHGRLGHGGATILIGDDEAPSTRPVLELGGTAEQITAGADHACALLTGGNVVCWGSNATGQNGNPAREAIGDDETPGQAGPIALGGVAVEVRAGAGHTCARMSTGGVRCWGSGTSGRLGYGNTNTIGNSETPGSVGEVNVGATVKGLGLGSNHTCAVTTAGAVRCWGSAARGQLGYANTNSIGDTEAPATAGDVKVSANAGDTVVQVALGNTRTCALLARGAVRCWGDNATGGLGYGNLVTIGDDEAPATAGDVMIDTLGAKASQIAFNNSHACALLDDGTLRCWGSGSDGQLGYGNSSTIGNDEVPAKAGAVPVGGTVTRVVAGTNHTCAVVTGGGVRCWGRGAGGRLGYGNTTTIGDTEAPLSAGTVDVGGVAVDLAAGDAFTCALLADKTVRCWGDDRGYGVLGQAVVHNLGDAEPPASAGDIALE